eukprot:1161517-Pelagomonas_calceolata.AAC.6
MYVCALLGVPELLCVQGRVGSSYKLAGNVCDQGLRYSTAPLMPTNENGNVAERSSACDTKTGDCGTGPSYNLPGSRSGCGQHATSTAWQEGVPSHLGRTVVWLVISRGLLCKQAFDKGTLTPDAASLHGPMGFD